MSQKKDSIVWTCAECNSDIEAGLFAGHLKEKHGITEMRGTQRMVGHMDGAKYFSSTYEVIFGGMKFYKHVTCEREKDDLMYY